MRHVANYEANKLKKKKWFNTKKEVRYEIWLLFWLIIQCGLLLFLSVHFFDMKECSYENSSNKISDFKR